ncbi:MAG: hypothetical protein HYR62_10755 [Actinobacteria bacterium]|nr:hypothetical protein [Actinomycetota bacterium]MBI3686787.1 hypothetical protein [Actinomycetota bacterium]
MDSDLIFVYEAGHEIEIGCDTDAGKRSTIQQDCAAVLDSLQILSTTS